MYNNCLNIYMYLNYKVDKSTREKDKSTREKNSFLADSTALGRVAKMKMAELLFLKVHQSNSRENYII